MTDRYYAKRTLSGWWVYDRRNGFDMVGMAVVRCPDGKEAAEALAAEMNEEEDTA